MPEEPPKSPRYRVVTAILRFFLTLLLWPLSFALARGTVALTTADGMVHIGGFPRFLLSGQSVKIWRSFASLGAGRPTWDLPYVQLSPDERLVMVSEIERIGSDVDFRLTLHATATGESLFTATDNSLPSVSFRGDDPAAPAALLAEQAKSDAYWEMERVEFPFLERKILTAGWFEIPNQSMVRFAGWTDDGGIRLDGHCPLRIDDGSSLGTITAPVGWWGIAAPVAGRVYWAWREQRVGSPPAVPALLPRPAPTRTLTLGAAVGTAGGQTLLLDGVEQTDAALAAGVISFDGPFTR